MAEAAKERNQLTAMAFPYQLPTDLLSLVLLNLPPKSILRFKCVSKQWLSLITDPYFIDTYNNFSNTRPGGVTIVIPPRFTYEWRFLIIDLNKPSRSRATVLDLKTFPPQCNRVTNMINGFICFYNDKAVLMADVYLYNLSTRELLALPPSDIKRQSRCYMSCHLGYNPTNKEYKVLKLCSDENHEVFTLGSSERWKVIGTHIPRRRCLPIQWNEFCVDGVLYYQTETENREPKLFAFDVEHETCEWINYPEDLIGSPSPTLAHIRGQVSLVHFKSAIGSKDIEIDVWRLFNNKGSDLMYKVLTPLWSRQTITWSFGYIDSLLRCNQVGQIYCLINDGSGQWVIEFYDIATSMTKKLKLNNPDGILFEYNFRFEPSKVPANISPLKYMKGRNASAN